MPETSLVGQRRLKSPWCLGFLDPNCSLFIQCEVLVYTYDTKLKSPAVQPATSTLVPPEAIFRVLCMLPLSPRGKTKKCSKTGVLAWRLCVTVGQVNRDYFDDFGFLGAPTATTPNMLSAWVELPTWCMIVCLTHAHVQICTCGNENPPSILVQAVCFVFLASYNCSAYPLIPLQQCVCFPMIPIPYCAPPP